MNTMYKNIAELIISYDNERGGDTDVIADFIKEVCLLLGKEIDDPDLSDIPAAADFAIYWRRVASGKSQKYNSSGMRQGKGDSSPITLKDLYEVMWQFNDEIMPGRESRAWLDFCEACEKNFGAMPWEKNAHCYVPKSGFANYWLNVPGGRHGYSVKTGERNA